VDFIVRDRRGWRVADLRAEEVEVIEDGAPQKLKVLRRVEGLRAMEEAPGLERREQRLDPLRHVRLIVLVIDRLSVEGRALAHRPVEDLMKQGIPPNTYYAVGQLKPAFQIVQPFTNEPYLVKWAAERVTGVKGARSEGVPAIGPGTREAAAVGYAAPAMAAAELMEEQGRWTGLAAAPLDGTPPGDDEVRVTVSAGGKAVAERLGFTVAP